ncbi:MAG TPA: protein kinase, partial [Polyangiales bacterium]
RISALVSHRNVLEVYDTGTLPDGSPFLVMERVNGQNLSHILQQGPMSLAAAVEVARQVLTGLCSLADAGVVHRDIKPDNLMLHDAGDGETLVKLVDFGISKRVSIEPQPKLTCQGTLIGTPQYMSPEQIRGQDVDVRTDLYATGAVLYEALAGHAPHESQNFSELVVAVLNAPLRPLREQRANCPAELERIVAKALSRAPDQRYATPRQMLAELDACARELELPVGQAAFEQEDPIDPIWMTPARISIPMLHRWWSRRASDVRRPLSLAAGMLLLAAPSATFQLLRSDAQAPVASATMHHAGEPASSTASTALLAAPQLPMQPSTQVVQAASLLAADDRAEHDVSASRARLELPAQAASTRPKRVYKEPNPAVAVGEQSKPEPPAAPDPVRRERWESTMDRALASMVRGQLEAARLEYQAATELDRAAPAGFRGLALVCARLGLAEDARHALQRYLTLAPDAEDASSLRARVEALPN